MFALTEVFDTLQGEGALVGQRMVFVRFAGCNLWNGTEIGRTKGEGDCARWCDTDFRPRLHLSLSELLDQLDVLWPKGVDVRWVCLTGGEPALQITDDLLRALKAEDWQIAVETNGTVAVKNDALVDHLTISPKAGSPLRQFRAHSVKVVLPGAWTETALSNLPLSIRAKEWFVQPQAGEPDSVKFCLDTIRRDPLWRLSLQTHKLIGIS